MRHPAALLIVHSGIATDEKLTPTGLRLPEFPRDDVLQPLHRTDRADWGYAMVFKSQLLSLSSAVPYPGDDQGSTGLMEEDQNLLGREQYNAICFGHDRYIALLADVFGNTVEIAESLVLHRTYADPRIRARFKTLKTLKKVETFVWHKRWQEWSDILRKARFRDATLVARAQEAATVYSSMAVLFATRTKLYEDSKLKRIRGMIEMIKLSGYRSRSNGGFGVLGFASDIAKLVL
jgi:hypothetical protein